MTHNIERAKVINPARLEQSQWATKPLTSLTNLTEAEEEVVRISKSGESQVREASISVTYHYWAPFNYPNIKVELSSRPKPFPTGAEFNMDGVELEIPPYGAITIVEKEPIIGVTVIGSACVPPGFVMLQAEPLEWKFPRSGVKMKIDNLWGQHLRGDTWRLGQDEGWRDAGLSCADFHLPESSKVTLMGGSQLDVGLHGQFDWKGKENIMPDPHYCFRVIRVTVKRAA